MFHSYDNYLSESLLVKLQQTYMSADIKWTHRGLGRFFCYFSEEIHNEILDDLYNNSDLPTYHNNEMMRDHHLYMQRYVPGSWLPLHREKTHGVLTICINDDENWSEDNPGPTFVWYDTQDLSNLKEHENVVPIKRNSGSLFIVNESYPSFNPFHKVRLNKSITDRYAVQMFFGPGFVQVGTVQNKNTTGRSIPYENNDYTVTAKQQTKKSLQTGFLETPGIIAMMPTMGQWAEDNSEIIARLTNG